MWSLARREMSLIICGIISHLQNKDSEFIFMICRALVTHRFVPNFRNNRFWIYFDDFPEVGVPSDQSRRFVPSGTLGDQSTNSKFKRDLLHIECNTISFLKTFLHHVVHKWGKRVQMSHKLRWSSPQLYKWVPCYRRWWEYEWIIFACNCSMARMLPRDVELVLEWTGLPRGGV